MTLKLRSLIGLLAALSACGIPEEEDAVGTKEEALTFENCSTASSLYSRSSGPFAASIYIYGGPQTQSAWQESTLVFPVGTTRSTVTANPRVEAGFGFNLVPFTGYARANTRVRLTVASGSNVLCSAEREIFDRESPTPLTGSVPVTTYPMSCSFNRDLSGAPVTARVELITYAEIGSPFPMQAQTNAFGTPGTLTQTHCVTRTNLCVGPGLVLMPLDANGDNRTDQLCYNPTSGTMSFNTTAVTGVPDESVDFSRSAFCTLPSRLLIGDVNSDGRDDLVCVRPSDRNIRVNFADASGRYSGLTDRTSAVGGSCNDARLGYFNADGFVDLMCEASPGIHAVDLGSASGGLFAGTEFFTSSFCALGDLFLADVNADGRDDQVCQTREFPTANRRIGVRFASTTGRFPAEDFNGLPNWCTHTGARVLLADANGDNRSDLICRTTGTGFIHADFSNASGPLFDGFNERSIDNDFCAATTGLVTIVDYTGSGREGLQCQVPATSGFGTITVQQLL